MSLNYKIIGCRVKEHRQRQRISQATLAEMTDMSVSFISHIETARRQASLESLVRISNALGLTIDELLTGNQYYDTVEYQTDFDLILSDCTSYEKRIIYELAQSIKNALRESYSLMGIPKPPSKA